MISLQDLLVREFQGKIFKGCSTYCPPSMKEFIGQKIKWVTLSNNKRFLPLNFGMESGETISFDYEDKISVE